MATHILMAQCKTAITHSLMHWSYHKLMLSHYHEKEGKYLEKMETPLCCYYKIAGLNGLTGA